MDWSPGVVSGDEQSRRSQHCFTQDLIISQGIIVQQTKSVNAVKTTLYILNISLQNNCKKLATKLERVTISALLVVALSCKASCL